MRRRPPDTRDPGLQLARRAEVALLFLVQEVAGAECRGGTEEEGREGRRDKTKSSNPNTEGGEIRKKNYK